MASPRKTTIWLLAAITLAASFATAFAFRNRRRLSRGNPRQHQKTRHVAINLLPASVEVTEGKNFSHEFTILGDATNASLNGEFSAEPRLHAQLDMLLVSSAGFRHWQQFHSPTGAPTDSSKGELIYHTGNTIADSFLIKLSPGTYDLVFDYGPPTGPTFSDHYGGFGPSYRVADTQITLSYDLPQETP